VACGRGSADGQRRFWRDARGPVRQDDDPAPIFSPFLAWETSMSGYPSEVRGPQAGSGLSPGKVLRHTGSRHCVLDRLHRLARQAVPQGRSALKEAAPVLAQCIADTNFLRLAWDHLAEHGGEAPGPGGDRYEDFTSTQVWQFCRGLRDELRSGQYQPGPERVIHISKGPGRGSRPLVLQSIEDRVVQRSALMVLQPFLDPLFAELSFGFRPRRGRLDALASAEWYSVAQQRRYWVTEDVQDAFLTVPLPCLLQVVQKHLVDEELVQLVGQIIGNAPTPGLRQGGALSPLLLNLYLHHFLDRKWAKLHPAIPLIRVADDLLLCCRTRAEARQAHADLSALLLPAGLKLKGDDRTAVHALTPHDPADWLGFTLTRRKHSLGIQIAAKAWDRLPEKLYLCHEKPDAPFRAGAVITGWLTEMGPTFRYEDRDQVYARMLEIAQEQAFAEIPSWAVAVGLWQLAYARWRKLRKQRLLALEERLEHAGGARQPNGGP